MEQFYRRLKPLANIYTILLSWILLILNFYVFMIPIRAYAKSAGLKMTPDILDALTYYTPDEGYEALTNLGPDGRHAYRLANYTDFVLPLLGFLSFALPHIAIGKGPRYIILPFIFMIADYTENLAEKYVLEIYPKRNDFVMTIACYFGLMKFITSAGCVLSVIVFLLQWLLQSKKSSAQKTK